MVLCFGTFASTLRFARLQGVTDKQLIGSMTRTVDKNCRYIEKGNDDSVSRLYACTGNFPNAEIEQGVEVVRKAGETLSLVFPLARKTKVEDIADEFFDAVIPLLDEDKKRPMILGLLDIIGRDELLDCKKTASFKKYVGMSKADLLKQKEFDLYDLLPRLFLYSVVCLPNTYEKGVSKELTQEWFDNLNGEITVEDKIENVDECCEPIITEPAPAPIPAPQSSFSLNFYGPVQNVNPSATTVITNNNYYNGVKEGDSE